MRGVYGAASECARPQGHQGKHRSIRDEREWTPEPPAARIRPYMLVRCTTSTGKYYMRRDLWDDMSDFGWGWRPVMGLRVSPYFELTDMEALLRWCRNYTATHPGNTLDPKEAESLATA